MSDIRWTTAIEEIKKYTFKILTPQGSGTGFQITYVKNNRFCGIATAYHVISHAFEWEEPIKVQHYTSQSTRVLTVNNRVIISIPERDLAFILFNIEDMGVLEEIPDLVPPQKSLKQGIEVGWCGFPSVYPSDLCFFSGYTSCFIENELTYLVDGVAINGVSGGPAFFLPHPDFTKPIICGVITAYLPNQTLGHTLPGLSVIRSVEPYQEMLSNLNSLDEADQKTEEVKQQALEISKDDPKIDKPVKSANK